MSVAVNDGQVSGELFQGALAVNASVASQAQVRWAERDFNISPMIVFYEVTRACDLVCLHCRACGAGLVRPQRVDN